jgi:antitoxin CptB|tara:strand:- start:1745 stop:2023 length:279 start_codon:yes stop_codon:yes gene_type:complete
LVEIDQQTRQQIGRLRWRCRRGARELDILFTRFLDTGYATLNEEQKAAFQALLNQQDPLILDWFLGRTSPDESALKEMVDLIKKSAKDVASG